MAELIHYEGDLGVFDYDPDVFTLETIHEYSNTHILRYIGSETDGSKIHIPVGITECDTMFRNCDSLVIPPAIPEGVRVCWAMFIGCISLTSPPLIPPEVEDCGWMFAGCTALEMAPDIPESVINSDDMFYGCSEKVQMQGQWNIEHRGMNYLQDYVEENETDELY